jgi:4'-phosphopantetheinyl transferase
VLIPPSLGPTDVHVWYRFTRSLSETAIANARRLLSPDEHTRWKRLVRTEDQRDYIAAHAMMRQALSAYAPVAPTDWAFSTETWGKPQLAGTRHASTLKFNLSHTRGLVACVVTRGLDVGIDVENINAEMDLLELARQNFSPAEVSALEACSSEVRPARFVEIWTLKEAYVKATGRGITGGLNHWGFRFESSDGLEFSAPPDSGDWAFALVAPSDGTRLSVAIQTAVAGLHRISCRPVSSDEWLPDAGVQELGLQRTSVVS